MTKFLSFVFVFFFMWGCSNQADKQRADNNLRNSLDSLGLKSIVPLPEVYGRTDYLLYVKDQYGNCYMIIHNANTYGYVRTPTTIPCSSVEKKNCSSTNKEE